VTTRAARPSPTTTGIHTGVRPLGAWTGACATAAVGVDPLRTAGWAAAGVTSPIALALVERRRETAVLRSLGQTRHSLRNALTIEQAALGSVGMALGLVFGVVGSVLTTRALFSGVDTGIFISVPWLSISIVIGLEFLVTVGLTAVPAKSWMERRSTSFRDGNFLRL